MKYINKKTFVASLVGATLLGSQAFAAGDPNERNFRVIVQLNPESSVSALQATIAPLGVSLVEVKDVATGATVVEVQGTTDTAIRDKAIALMNQSGLAQFAELDLILTPQATPNDTRYNEQWHYFESTAGINGPAAWDITTGSGVTVAVIDTGYRNHVDLNSKILPGYDFISDATMGNDGNGRDSDAQDPGDWVATNECYSGSPASNSSWHGTHVAGTVAAETNNGQGVAGVAWNADILPIRVLGKCGGYTSDIADGIIWSSGGSVSGVPTNNNPAQVLNLSLGGSGSCPSTTQSAINTARANGSTVVVAAGNSNQNAANFTPASCSGVVTVASVNRSGDRAYYSNYGSVVDIAAPGGETSVSSNGVLSTLNSGSSTPGSDNYSFYQGTSMAAPHIAGVAALMYAVDPSITPDEVESDLVSTARSFPGSCSQCGSGIVDAAAAVVAAQGGGTPPASCPTGYTEYAGNLTGAGDNNVEPNGTYYYSGASGTHSGELTGPGGTDFDLGLYKWLNSRWTQVSSSTSSSSVEEINYSSGAGYFYWDINSYSGSGNYTFCLKTP
ncbi:S8 family peptidase [Aliiglaciecola litoralis]|uniref:Peptidase S8/S53 domain-containing protein n=1 Tax=Aliiglaciecola litoralis TaxID=582857 RepID=A0ABN1LPR2_9ALTE